MTIVRIPNESAPIIDGDISDTVWTQAATSDKFRQVFPVEGATPSERTVVSLLFDDKTLYVAIHAYDRTPGAIVANIMKRDGDLEKGDLITVLIDSHNSGRNAFAFEINPLGTRREGLIENNALFRTEWNTIWRGKAKVTASGWTAEIAIPFQSISQSENATSWGFQVLRLIARRNEQIRWASPHQSFGPFNMSQAGRLQGIKNVDTGIGLDVEVLGSIEWIRKWERPGREDDFQLNPSGNIYYKITSSLNAMLTVNTDFSSTSLDSRQINTGRFALFFPEQRDFFLQDASLFEFGGRSLSIDEGNVNGLPFFSRRIGLVGNEAVTLTAGAKLSGTIGGINLGALTTRMAGGDAVDPQFLSVVRASTRLFSESQVGIIATYGDPTGKTENAVLGADVQVLNSAIFNKQRLLLDGFFLTSFSDTSDERGNMFGAELALPNDRIFTYLRFRQIDESYRPALGFLNRPGIKAYNGEFRYRHRLKHEFIRFVEAGTWAEWITDLDDRLEDRENGIWVGMQNNEGDELFVNFANVHRDLREGFFLPKDVFILAGPYDWNRVAFFLGTSSSRVVTFKAEAECCDFFDGTRRFLSLTAELRPSRYLNLSANHLIEDFDLPGGEVTVHVSQVSIDLNFTPDIQFTSQIQYDSISQNLDYLGRFFWEIRPETELFVSLSTNAITNIRDFRTRQSGAVIKIGHTFRY